MAEPEYERPTELERDIDRPVEDWRDNDADRAVGGAGSAADALGAPE